MCIVNTHLFVESPNRSIKSALNMHRDGLFLELRLTCSGKAPYYNLTSTQAALITLVGATRLIFMYKIAYLHHSILLERRMESACLQTQTHRAHIKLKCSSVCLVHPGNSCTFSWFKLNTFKMAADRIR